MYYEHYIPEHLTNSIEQNYFSETCSASVTQEFPTILRNTKILYHIYETQSLVLILSQMDPFRTLIIFL